MDLDEYNDTLAEFIEDAVGQTKVDTCVALAIVQTYCTSLQYLHNILVHFTHIIEMMSVCVNVKLRQVHTGFILGHDKMNMHTCFTYVS